MLITSSLIAPACKLVTNSARALVFPLFFSLFLSACGGGAGTTSNTFNSPPTISSTIASSVAADNAETPPLQTSSSSKVSSSSLSIVLPSSSSSVSKTSASSSKSSQNSSVLPASSSTSSLIFISSEASKISSSSSTQSSAFASSKPSSSSVSSISASSTKSSSSSLASSKPNSSSSSKTSNSSSSKSSNSSSSKSSSSSSSSSLDKLNYQAFYADSFEGSAQAGGGANFSWSGGAWSFVNADVAKNGGKSLRFRYPAGANTSAEERFVFSLPHKEIWVKYWLRVPTNFEHVAPEPHWPTNNKLFALWMDDYSAHGKGPSVIWEYWDNGQGGSDLAVHFSEGNNTGAGPHLQFQPFINSSTDKGRWMQLVLHVKAATTTAGVSNNNGLIETYRKWDGDATYTRLHQVTQANIAPAISGPNGWQAGYFMGWSNPGFSAQTDFYIDDVEFADAMDLSAGASTSSSMTSSSSSSAQSSAAASSSTSSSISSSTGQLQFNPWMLLDADNGSNLGSNMIPTTEKVAFGTKAWKTTATIDADEWAMGGGTHFPAVLKKGQSLQAQWSVFFPTDFDWYAGGGGRLKMFRIRTEPLNGGNSGYHDIYINTLGLGAGSSEDGKITNIFEGVQQWHNTNEFMTKGVWNTFEIRVDFDNISFDQGGKGRTRVWRKKNNQMQLVLDVKSAPTLVNATDVAPFFYIFTYWNGGAPKTQSMYIDRIVFETDLSRLVETDSAGNKIIGGL